jgi:dephospho-CoA kinase
MKLSTTKLNFKGKPPVVFAFFGKQGSGKDTSAQYLAEAVQEEMNRGHDRLYRFKGKGFVNEMRLNDESNPTGIIISFAGALKEEVYSLYDKIRIQSNLDYSMDDWGKILMDEYDINEEQATTTVSLIFAIPKGLKKKDFLINQSKPKGYREILQYWGTQVRRKQKDSYWIEKLGQRIEELDAKYKKEKERLIFVVSDARFINELNYCADFLQAYMMYLDVPDDVRMKRLKKRDGFEPKKNVKNHVSETELVLWANQNEDKFIKLSSRYKTAELISEFQIEELNTNYIGNILPKKEIERRKTAIQENLEYSSVAGYGLFLEFVRNFLY